MDVLEEMWLLVDEYIAPGADRLVLAASFGGRARHTGIDMELHPFHVLKLRDGKIIRWEIYTRRSEALEAVGLSE
jgi:ketosteroid isomerase-like protein